MKKRMNKKGKVLFETIIFIVLNIVFFVVMLIFIQSSGNRAFIFEQTLAKEVALIMDHAKPEMSILLDISKFVEVAKENNQEIENIIRIEDNNVEVRLKQKGGYSYQYFSDYDISFKIEKEQLLININENE